MSHFCPGLESEHCSKSGPTITVLLPARQSGEEKWLNSHCYCPHPQPLQLSKLSHNTACGAGQLPCTCAEFAVTGITHTHTLKKKTEWIEKSWENEVIGAVYLPAPVPQWSNRPWNNLRTLCRDHTQLRSFCCAKDALWLTFCVYNH